MWTMKIRNYVKAAINNVYHQLKKKGDKLPNEAVTRMTKNYAYKLHEPQELDSDGVMEFQELIIILHQAIEIGRVDILSEVSILYTYNALPRQGHFEQLYHIFESLKKNPKLTVYFDPIITNNDPSWFLGYKAEIFKDKYHNAEDELNTQHMKPHPLGQGLSTAVVVDAFNAANNVTRIPHSDFILFVNKEPIFWYIKRLKAV